jgi:hypothetical protein
MVAVSRISSMTSGRYNQKKILLYYFVLVNQFWMVAVSRISSMTSGKYTKKKLKY